MLSWLEPERKMRNMKSITWMLNCHHPVWWKTTRATSGINQTNCRAWLTFISSDCNDPFAALWPTITALRRPNKTTKENLAAVKTQVCKICNLQYTSFKPTAPAQQQGRCSYSMSLKPDKAISLTLLEFAEILLWPLCWNQTCVGGRRDGPSSQLADTSTCIFIVGVGQKHPHTHVHAHRDTHIIVSLWDQENAQATVNVKTRPPSRDTWIAFHSTKTPFIFLLTNLWRKHHASRGIGRATWTLRSLSPSISLCRSQHCPHLICFAEEKDTDKTHYLQHAPVTQIKALRLSWLYVEGTDELRRKASV